MTRAVRRSDLERILGMTEQAGRSETLLPPLTRLLAGRLPTTAATLETLLPPLRTHRLSMFSQPASTT